MTGLSLDLIYGAFYNIMPKFSVASTAKRRVISDAMIYNHPILED